jgi:hypothetical protein
MYALASQMAAYGRGGRLIWLSADDFKQGDKAVAAIAATRKSEEAARIAEVERKKIAAAQNDARLAKEKAAFFQNAKAGKQLRCEATKRPSSYSMWSDFSCDGAPSGVGITREELGKYGWHINSQQTLTNSDQYREIILVEKTR